MGTRGLIGFYKDKTTKAMYNHWDSYPNGLGRDVLRAIKGRTTKELNDTFDRIILVVEHKTRPTKEQIEECKEFNNLEVGEDIMEHSYAMKRRIDDWYNLLREAQGRLDYYIDGKLRYMIDSKDFIKDSLFCEWGYIVNLDTNELEVWRGFQKTSNKNRYSIDKPDDSGYYSCDIMTKFPLSDLPLEDKFVAELERIDAIERE